MNLINSEEGSSREGVFELLLERFGESEVFGRERGTLFDRKRFDSDFFARDGVVLGCDFSDRLRSRVGAKVRLAVCRVAALLKDRCKKRDPRRTFANRRIPSSASTGAPHTLATVVLTECKVPDVVSCVGPSESDVALERSTKQGRPILCEVLTS